MLHMGNVFVDFGAICVFLHSSLKDTDSDLQRQHSGYIQNRKTVHILDVLKITLAWQQ